MSQIEQKTYIDLNENGTEAAAVTMVEMSGSPGPEPEPEPEKEYYMYVNHSFIYMIQSYKIKDIENKYLMPFIGIVSKLEDGKNINIAEETTKITEENNDDEEFIKINNQNHL